MRLSVILSWQNRGVAVMSDIRRNSENNPFDDSVTAEINSVITRFDILDGVFAQCQDQEECNVLCSFSEGVLCLSLRNSHMMITVRLDEICEIIAGAADVSRNISTKKD